MDNARDFAARLLDLLRHEQGAMADFLVALAAFDEGRLWMQLGHASLFTFLHRELGLSKGASHFRKVAAELIQRFPEVVPPLRDGRICITSIVELAKVMTPENRAEVLPRFFHASKQEAKAVAAEICPQEAVPQRVVVTALPATAYRPLAALAPASPVRQPVAEVRPVELAPSAPPAPALPTPPRTVAEPLNADLRRLHVTVSKRFMAKLEAARDALSHSNPGADAEAILEAGLDLLIARAAKRVGIVAKPRAVTPPRASAQEKECDPRVVPAAVKREVWARAGGRCQWRLENGEFCGSTHRLQLDHILPVARGGRSTVENLRVLCAGHNLLAARRVFGDAIMDRYAPAGPLRRERSPRAAEIIAGAGVQRGAGPLPRRQD
jgi:5-methylcytosine-specific restriction endonuclease McrA